MEFRVYRGHKWKPGSGNIPTETKQGEVAEKVMNKTLLRAVT